MKLQELAPEISARTGVDPVSVQRICKAALETLREEIGRAERVTVPRFGVFIKKQTRGGERIVFKSAATASTDG